MIKLTEKEISILKVVSLIAGIFTMIVALTMIFSLIQLKTINPLDNPAFVSVKEQYDKDPENALYAENVRAMDLMARKAYFATRRQVETGAYLLLVGAIVFILCQRLVVDNEKAAPSIPGTKPDHSANQTRNRRYILATALMLTISAVVISFILMRNLPDLKTDTTVKATQNEVSGKTKRKKRLTKRIKLPGLLKNSDLTA